MKFHFVVLVDFGKTEQSLTFVHEALVHILDLHQN